MLARVQTPLRLPPSLDNLPSGDIDFGLCRNGGSRTDLLHLAKELDENAISSRGHRDEASMRASEEMSRRRVVIDEREFEATMQLVHAPSAIARLSQKPIPSSTRPAHVARE